MRFILVGLDEARRYKDPDEIAGEWRDDHYDYATFLVDTEKGEVVFADGGEPEDASLARDYGVLVDLLNQVDQEAK